MIKLECLQDSSPRKRRTKLLGRGPSSGHGKTSGRGHKGDGSRSGYKKRHRERSDILKKTVRI